MSHAATAQHSLHSHNHTHLHRTLQHRLSAVWSHHAIAGANNVTLVDASHGILHNKQCSTPSLFIWIAGHYRTFAWTQHHLAAVAAASSSCAFVAAFMPDEVDAEKEYSTPGAFGRVDGHKLRNALNATSISSLLRHAAATTFAKRNLPFAFAIVQRHGSVARYPGALCLGWHGVYVLTSWAAQAHSLHLDDSAVVVRTRPDVLLTRPMQIDGLMKYFAEGGEMARHVALGNYVKNYKGARTTLRATCMRSSRSERTRAVSSGHWSSLARRRSLVGSPNYGGSARMRMVGRMVALLMSGWDGS